MEFQQFYLGCLSHASYLFGSEGAAVVVDPQRDIEIYLDEAAKLGMEIRFVVETHLHADFVSGHLELARRTGAAIYIGAEARAAFPHVPVTDGMELKVGTVLVRFLTTPGHTIESISLVLTDLEKGPEPWAVLTGDTLFIGDVGRPDLSPNHTPQQLAGLLYGSLAKLTALPDATLVYPAHGAGSLCGRQLSADRCSTIGLQKAANYALRAASREEFVTMLTTDLPERPQYFLRDAEINRTGAPALAGAPPLPALTPGEFHRQMEAGMLVLDSRPSAKFLAAHIPGSLNIGLVGQFASWAGAILGVDTLLLLVAEDDEQVEETRVRLARVGLDGSRGYLAGGLAAWERAGLPLATLPEIAVEDLARRRDEFCLIDVRRPPEWTAGHVPGALHIPLDQLLRRVQEIPLDRRVAVMCQGGYRSAIAASLLAPRLGAGLVNVEGGFSAWCACRLPAEA
jgi:glyoxylase-like metal-dependent hydrolase (beta-lactamase superfamily II)/rhodanese-related sulfurtransferase